MRHSHGGGTGLDILKYALLLILGTIPEARGKPEAVLEMLELCQKNNGLVVGREGILGYIRYDDTTKKLVRKAKINQLKKFDLTKGPYGHVMVFVATEKGKFFSLVREAAKTINPEYISYHTRRGDGPRKFVFRRNQLHKPA